MRPWRGRQHDLWRFAARLWRDDGGQSLVEYSLVLVLVVAACAGLTAGFARILRSFMWNIILRIALFDPQWAIDGEGFDS